MMEPTTIRINWDSIFTMGRDTSIQMKIAEVLVKPSGVVLNLMWVHNGDVKTQWVPQHLLDEYVPSEDAT